MGWGLNSQKSLGALESKLLLATLGASILKNHMTWAGWGLNWRKSGVLGPQFPRIPGLSGHKLLLQFLQATLLNFSEGRGVELSQNRPKETFTANMHTKSFEITTCRSFSQKMPSRTGQRRFSGRTGLPKPTQEQLPQAFSAEKVS